MRFIVRITVAATLTLAAIIATGPMANAAAYSKCKACHNFTAKSKVGPGWKGIYGRKAGSMPGFRYKFTKYIKGDPWVWDEAHLRKWMCNSKEAVKEFTGDPHAKTKMPPQKVCDKAKQDEIIAFMKTL